MNKFEDVNHSIELEIEECNEMMTALIETFEKEENFLIEGKNENEMDDIRKNIVFLCGNLILCLDIIRDDYIAGNNGLKETEKKEKEIKDKLKEMEGIETKK